MRGRRPRSRAGSEKSDNKSVYSQRDFLEDNAEITSSYWQDPANKEAGDSLSGYNPQQEDTEPISQPEAAAPNGTGKQEKVEKN